MMWRQATVQRRVERREFRVASKRGEVRKQKMEKSQSIIVWALNEIFLTRLTILLSLTSLLVANNTRDQSDSATKRLSALDWPPAAYSLPRNGHSEWFFISKKSVNITTSTFSCAQPTSPRWHPASQHTLARYGMCSCKWAAARNVGLRRTSATHISCAFMLTVITQWTLTCSVTVTQPAARTHWTADWHLVGTECQNVTGVQVFLSDYINTNQHRSSLWMPGTHPLARANSTPVMAAKQHYTMSLICKMSHRGLRWWIAKNIPSLLMTVRVKAVTVTDIPKRPWQWQSTQR